MTNQLNPAHQNYVTDLLGIMHLFTNLIHDGCLETSLQDLTVEIIQQNPGMNQEDLNALHQAASTISMIKSRITQDDLRVPVALVDMFKNLSERLAPLLEDRDTFRVRPLRSEAYEFTMSQNLMTLVLNTEDGKSVRYVIQRDPLEVMVHGIKATYYGLASFIREFEQVLNDMATEQVRIGE